MGRSRLFRAVALCVALVMALSAPPLALAKGGASSQTATSGSGGAAAGSAGGAAAQSSSSAAAQAAAGAAQAANPNNPLSAFPQPPVSTAPTSQTATVVPNGATGANGSSSFSGNSVFVIAIGAIVVLVGISMFIWRDARRRAPVKGSGSGTLDVGRRAGSKAAPKPRKLSPAERRRRKRGRARS